MKNTLWLAGFSSLAVAIVLYLLGYTNLNYFISGVAVFIYPAGFFFLLGLLLMAWAIRREWLIRAH